MEFKNEQDSERRKIGDKWIDNDRLFVKWKGNPMHPQTPYGARTDFLHRLNDYGIDADFGEKSIT